MSYTTTPVLGMKLAVPGSGQAFETTQVNANFLLIDTAIGDIQTGLPSLPVPVAQGGTGSTSASDARTALGLGSIATRPFTTGAGDPTGGSNGDLYGKIIS